MGPAVDVSVVSHGQAPLVERLLRDLEDPAAFLDLRVHLTLNAPEPLPFDARAFRFALEVVTNEEARGFGANHNAAFARCRPSAPWFCLVNPDVRMGPEVLPRLVDVLSRDPALGVIAPLVVGSDGRMQDSARPLPSPAGILAKAVGLGAPVGAGRERNHPDWVAGMMMVMPSAVFAELHGFDERFHLYYEDVDLCCRARLLGYEVALDATVAVVHDGARRSHRSPRFLAWHLASMVRFFGSDVYRQAAARLRARAAGRTARTSDAC